MRRKSRFELNAYYYAGRNSRNEGNQKTPPATYSWTDRHWWLAGWNDRDMEIIGP